MSGSFDTLIYTDCRSGTGLSGIAGLQFQARSAGADDRAMTLVRNNLLYEPPSDLMQERRSPGEYPPSFAHICDDVIATAAGIYLGRGISSGREGNQLTHAIVTRDPGSYGFVRPAQLFGAPFWRARPGDSTVSEVITPGWIPGPFDAMRAQEFVKSQPRGDDLLCSLVSALERIEPGGRELRRIVFVAREAQAVLNWIAAATLLLPQRRALAIGFKIFTGNPAYAKHAVVAVHPDWGTFGATLENDLGYTIVDLVRREWSQVAPTSSARAWTDLFLAENPYDVVDAVEFVAASGLNFDNALHVALAAIVGRLNDQSTAEDAVSWLLTGPQDLVANYADAIAGLLVDSGRQWPTSLLLQLDRAGGGGAFQARRKAVRLALLDSALAFALSSGATVSERVEPLPPQLWTSADDVAAVDRVVTALRAASVDKIEAVLRIAGNHSLPLIAAEIRPELERFVAFWAQRPTLPYRSELWPCQQEITSLLYEQLTNLMEASPASAEQIGENWWPLLLAEPYQIETKLDAVVVSTAMRHLPALQRLEVVRRCLTSQQAASGIIEAASQLWRRTPPTAAEAHVLSSLVDRGTKLDPSAFETLDRQLSSGVAIADAMEAGEVLRGQGLWQPSPVAARIWAADKLIAKLCHELKRGQATYSTVSQARGLAPDSLLRAREPQLQDALMEAALAVSVLETLKGMPWLTLGYQQRLLKALTNASDPAHVVMAFVLTRPLHLTEDMKRQIHSERDDALKRIVRKWVVRASQVRRDQATAQIRNFLPPIPEEWRSMLHERRGWRRLFPGNPG